MTPAKGTRLAQYRLEDRIGAGGMGEVWRAVDTTLDRSVAVKILPEALADEPHRLARFEREAKVLASLNHPNIAVVHGLHSAEGIHFLAMELVGGEDLSQRLERGPLPIDEAVAIARQVAEALEAAHDSGVVHRDLKPANIQVTPEGKVKVLDFGLAKAFDLEPGSAQASASLSPTMTAAATLAGVILGTAAYMSPEQARGRAVDRRADIWAFGCVLYEMLAGRRLFEGETVSDTLAAVLRSEPDWTALPAATPPGIRALLRWCLEKDPKKRLQAIGDARLALDGMLPAQEAPATGTASAGASAARIRERLAWSLAAVLAAASVALFVFNRPQPSSAAVTTRALIEAPAGTRFDFVGDRSGSLSISPDGRQITFSVQSPAGDSSLWVRPVDSMEGRALPGTRSATWPFWSPDSKYVAFFADGKLKRIDLAGSPPTTICDAKDGRGGSWNRDGIILFAPTPNTGIFSVPAAGGTPQPQTTLDAAVGETTHRWATFLPDGRHFLYLAGTHGEGVRSEINAIYVAEMGKPGRRRLLLNRSNVAYASGHLLYVRERVLLAQPFDPDRQELLGEPVPVAEGVGYDMSYFRGVDAVSESGFLVYMKGMTVSGSRLAWYGRDGKPLEKVADLGVYDSLSLSPDESRVAFGLTDADSGMQDIWVLDVARGVRSRLTFGQSNEYAPVWSPDGTRVVYAVSALVDDLFIRPAAGGDEQVFLKSKSDKRPTDWSRDGRLLVFTHIDATPTSKTGVWVWPVLGKEEPRPFVDGEFNERDGRLSPDGRWMLYTSDESGRFELYVAPFPGPGGKWQVSPGGAITGWWTLGGKEIVYAAPDLTMMSVAVRPSGATFAVDSPRPLFRTPCARWQGRVRRPALPPRRPSRGRPGSAGDPGDELVGRPEALIAPELTPGRPCSSTRFHLPAARAGNTPHRHPIYRFPRATATL